LSYSAVYQALRAVCEAADIEPPWPRPHDLRHTFAITRVASWYAEERSVDPLLPALSTYLGHVSVENTRHYLIANGVLLEKAAVRFERTTRGLEVQP
jgi:integrase